MPYKDIFRGVEIKKELGFVLRRFLPNKNKFSLLTSSLGKLDITTSPTRSGERLWPGMLISCFLRSTNSKVYMAHATEVLMAPLGDASKEIKWFHGLLEASYYFLPPENPARDAFRVLFQAFKLLGFKEMFDEEFDVAKKMFFLSLFKCFGFFPDGVFVSSFPVFEKLVFGSVDFKDGRAVESLKIMLQGIDDKELCLMDSWIERCMMRHPNVRLFKSATFK